MNFFGSLPRIIPELHIGAEEIYPDNVYFLQNAVYVGIDGSPFDEQGLEFLKAVLKVTNLEVLILDHWGEEGEWEVKFFNEFCAVLSSCQAFLSHFWLLKIFSLMKSSGLLVSRKNFNKLMTAYLAAPTDHMQKLHITCTKIKCSDVLFDCSPEIDQRYLAFKTVELGGCQFVSKYKATPQTVSHWLGQCISELSQSHTNA